MQLRIFTEPQQGASYDTLLAIARATEDGGFDAFFRSDHYMAIWAGRPPGPTDAWISLAGLARDTSRIRLGTLVSPVTFRLPGPLAIMVATVDAMSGGRAELGLGTGWYEAEHNAYGIPFPPFGERFAMLEEQVGIVLGLWQTPAGERYSHSGPRYTLTDSPALPKPVQSPNPPLIIGGTGPRRTPDLAARHADEFNLPPFTATERGREQLERVREACERAGRDPVTLRLSASLTVCCGRDGDEVRRRAAAIGHEVEALRTTGLAGTPAEIVDRLGVYGDMGVSRVYLQVLDLDDLAHIELLAAEVLPQV
ncbi:MAG TPA: LLM class F420-dependent oxidoreductase [Candidatus Dormibacteraeota bacterium]|nr:LLM class F420-dependent oxidoreductase [Candidatus Dormibacteraeota bacterium]